MAAGRPGRRTVGRCGFTLVEMLVALAVLVIALGVVTTVFSMTARTARSAVAINETEAFVRDFLLQLEQDLDGIDPAESLLVLHGGTQAAGRTEEERDAGQYYRVLVGDPEQVPVNYDSRFATNSEYSDPRCDIMMFFTNREAVSLAPATRPGNLGYDEFGRFQRALANGAAFSPLLVVYGQAAFGRPQAGSNPWPVDGDLTHIYAANANTMSRVSASQWHLARRATIINQWSPGAKKNPNVNDLIGMNDGILNLADDIMLDRPGTDFAGDAVNMDLARLLQIFGPGSDADPTRRFARADPYDFPYDAEWRNPAPALIWGLLYGNTSEDTRYHHIATVIENPPAELATNLGLQSLPGCAWFQVEFLLPEDARNAVDYSDSVQRDDMPRWVEIEPGETYVFVPDSAENRELVRSQVTEGKLPTPSGRHATFSQRYPPQLFGSAAGGSSGPGGTGPGGASGQNKGGGIMERNVRMWPYAVRITVRVFDQDGRLDAPIVRSLVHRFD